MHHHHDQCGCRLGVGEPFLRVVADALGTQETRGVGQVSAEAGDGDVSAALGSMGAGEKTPRRDSSEPRTHTAERHGTRRRSPPPPPPPPEEEMLGFRSGETGAYK